MKKKFRIIYFELVFFTTYVNIFCIVEKKFNYKVLNQMDRAIMGHEFRVLITLLMPKSFRHLMQRIHQFRGKGRVGQLSLAPELRLNSQLYDRPTRLHCVLFCDNVRSVSFWLGFFFQGRFV